MSYAELTLSEHQQAALGRIDCNLARIADALERLASPAVPARPEPKKTDPAAGTGEHWCNLWDECDEHSHEDCPYPVCSVDRGQIHPSRVPVDAPVDASDDGCGPDPDNPCAYFRRGPRSRGDCDGDGHYRCNECTDRLQRDVPDGCAHPDAAKCQDCATCPGDTIPPGRMVFPLAEGADPEAGEEEMPR